MRKKGNPVAKAVRTPRFRMKVCRDKTKFNRKIKHKVAIDNNQEESNVPAPEEPKPSVVPAVYLLH